MIFKLEIENNWTLHLDIEKIVAYSKHPPVNVSRLAC
jgi:hypothetical protein